METAAQSLPPRAETSLASSKTKWQAMAFSLLLEVANSVSYTLTTGGTYDNNKYTTAKHPITKQINNAKVYFYFSPWLVTPALI